MKTGARYDILPLTRRAFGAVLLLALLALLADIVHSQDPPRRRRVRRGPPPTVAPAPEQPKEEEEKPPAEDDRYLAITGGVVHTVSGADLHGATVLCKNGVIQAIGRDVTIPKDAETIDATGHHVYPGLIALRSFGIVGSSNTELTTDVFDLSITMALAGGLTTVVSGEDAVKLTYGSIDDMVVKRGLWTRLSYTSSNPSGKHTFREALERARQHLRDVEAFEEATRRKDPSAKKPDERWIRGTYKTAMDLIKGDAVAIVTAREASSILELCGLARQYGIRVVFEGPYEAWTVARELAQSGAAAIVTPRRQVDPDDTTNRPNGTSIENARILWEHGVPLGIVPSSTSISTGGLAGRDLLHLPMEAAFAVRGGLPQRVALEAITIQAARILGADHRIGSIEVGKDADFAITDGDMLHYMTHVRWTVVNGRVVYDKTKEPLFSHIRPGGDRDAPPPDDYWPRGLGEEW